MADSERKIGAHVSAAGGVEKAVERAAAIGCNCVQVFSGSPRVWAKPGLEKYDVETIAHTTASLHVSPIFTHALYLVNIASDQPELVQKSMQSLAYELSFDSLVGGKGVVVHLGSHQGRGFDAVKEQLVQELDVLLKGTPATSQLLIENAASRNGKIGGNLEEIAYLLDSLEHLGGWLGKGRVGWCFDTCHGFAAGYYLGAQPPAQNGLFPALSAIASIEELALVGALKLIHANGSRDPFASNRDRHANFGEGELSLDDMAFFLNHPLIASIPVVTEVPGIEGNGPDAENIGRLKAIVE